MKLPLKHHTFVIPGSLAAILVMGTLEPTVMASTQSAQPSKAHAASASTASTHATKGVVKSIDDNALVVSRPSNRGDITFKLSPTTHRDGKIAVGSTVSVRYHEDGKEHVATAIALQKS